jgi:hypothetical protein
MLRLARRSALASVAGVLSVLVLAPSAHADPVPVVRATSIVNSNFHTFMAIKASTPSPFDWSDDGCSGPTWDAGLPFSADPCRQHDFGYRNFGRGLQLGRDEAHRSWIDDRLKAELQRSCDERYIGFIGWLGPLCRQSANSFHIAVRNWGRGAFYG